MAAARGKGGWGGWGGALEYILPNKLARHLGSVVPRNKGEGRGPRVPYIRHCVEETRVYFIYHDMPYTIELLTSSV